MPALPPNATKVHLDQDSDDIYQARAELAAHGDAINQIIAYLNGLFGFDGVKITAQNVFGAGFTPGTVMAFVNPTVPLGWVNIPQANNFYLVCGGNGGSQFGSFLHTPTTSSTALSQAHLPSISLIATTDYQGDHTHNATRTGIQAPNPGVTSVQVAQGSSYFVWLSSAATSTGGIHAHNLSVPLGGQNAGHTHVVNFNSYRPLALQVLLGAKT